MSLTLPISAAAPEGLITSQPEGTLYSNVYTSCREFLISNGMPGRTNNDGYNTEMVINGNEIYLHNIIRDYSGIDSWIKGTITDGVAEFKLPQPIHYTAGDAADGSNDIILYAEMFKAHYIDPATKEIIPDTENASLRMSWDGTSLTEILPNSSTEDLDYDGLCGLANKNHNYMNYGSQNIRMKVWDTKPLEAPTTLDTSDYTITYTNSWDSKMSHTIKMGVDGTNMWIQGLNTFIPESWVKGEIAEDGSVTIPSGQYMGMTQGYYMFLMSAEYSHGSYILKDATVLRKEGDTYVADNAMLPNLGNQNANHAGASDMRGAVIAPFSDVALTPADPMIIEGTYEDGYSLLTFMILPTDPEGTPLDQDRLYFNVFVDGELYTFTPEVDYVSAPITDVPYTFNEEAMIMGSEGFFVVGIEGEVKTIGVQACYRNGKDGTDITKSELVTEVFTSGISDTLTDTPVVDTRFYNLNGIEVKNPENGLFIRRATHANGKVETTKVVIR